MSNEKAIEHGWLEKGKQAAKHKYIARIPIKNDKFRYIYSMAEYKAIQAKSKAQEAVKAVSSSQKEVRKSSSVETGKKIADTVSNQKVGFLFYIPPSYVRKAADAVSSLIDRLSHQNPNTSSKVIENEDDRKERDASVARKWQSSEIEPEFLKNIPEKEEIGTSLEDQKAVNPDYPEDGTTSNCGYCTATFELRKRGYDVSAAKDDDGTEIFASNDWYKDAHYEVFIASTTLRADAYVESLVNVAKDGSVSANVSKENTAAMVRKTKEIMSVPNSRGDWRVMWSPMGTGGHSMAYETDANGVTKILDCQTGYVYTVDQVSNYISMSMVTRTDNLEMKEGILEVIER